MSSIRMYGFITDPPSLPRGPPARPPSWIRVLRVRVHSFMILVGLMKLVCSMPSSFTLLSGSFSDDGNPSIGWDSGLDCTWVNQQSPTVNSISLSFTLLMLSYNAPVFFIKIYHTSFSAVYVQYTGGDSRQRQC